MRFSQSHYPPLPPMRRYYYAPQPQDIDYYWTTPIELYYYLLYNSGERRRILNEIAFYHPGRRRLVTVYHPCAEGLLLYSNDNDAGFIRQLCSLIYEEQSEHWSFINNSAFFSAQKSLKIA